MACSWLLLVSLVSLVSLSTSLTVQAAPAVDDAADRPVPAASPEEFRVARRGPLGSNFIRFGRPVSWNLPREPSTADFRPEDDGTEDVVRAQRALSSNFIRFGRNPATDEAVTYFYRIARTLANNFLRFGR